MFDRKGQILLEAGALGEDAAMEKALEAGAEDFAREDDTFIITTAPNDLHAVKAALETAGLKAAQAELSWIPKSTVPVAGDAASQLLKLIEGLEDLEDVQKVDANFEMDESEMTDA
jgi:transcriptional/translational regulatory protein YebC/TACO1